MEKDFKKLYFELKEKYDSLCIKLKKKEAELRDLQAKHMDLLLKIENTEGKKSKIFSFTRKRSTIKISNKKVKEPIKVPIRLMILLVILGVLVTYLFNTAKTDNEELYAQITRGMVFPKRAIASIADIFYHK